MSDVECVVWWSPPLEPRAEYLAMLNAAERERYDAYRREDDRCRFLTGRVMLRMVVAPELGCEPADVPVDATCPDCGKPHGRPRVAGTDLELSVSHSGDRVGLAVVVGIPVGLDVESTARPVSDNLVAYALSDEERAQLDELPDAERTAGFFRYWSRKEAVMKATGQGLRIPLRSFTVAPPGETPRLVGAANPELVAVTVVLADLEPGAGYRASVAVLAAGPLHVTETPWREKFRAR